jgi:hypothetical protein
VENMVIADTYKRLESGSRSWYLCPDLTLKVTSKDKRASITGTWPLSQPGRVLQIQGIS